MPPSKFNNDIIELDVTCCNPRKKCFRFNVDIIQSYVTFHRPH